jgi:branched-chain amino acid transport system ATP-binding protein
MDQSAPDSGAAGPPAEEALLATVGVGKTFGGFHALRDVSVSVTGREILGIIGPNGAGKTTLFNLIAGAFRPTSGRIIFKGDDVTRQPPHRRLRKGIARTFQLIRPFGSMTIYENVVTAAMGSGAPRARATARATATVDRLGLGAIAGKRASDVNAVEGKRLEVARALATRPEVILLDEIFSGLSADEVSELAELVTGVRGEGITVLVIEHNVRAIKAVADRVIAIDTGRVVSEGSPEHVLSDPHVVESYLGQRAHA